MDEEILDEINVGEEQEYKYNSFFFWGGVLIVGIMFVIQHWPFGNLIMLAGYAGLMAYSLISLFVYKQKQIEIIISFVFNCVFLWDIVFGIKFLQFNKFNYKGVVLYFGMTLLFFIYHWLVQRMKKK